jgi:hypothetical protein
LTRANSSFPASDPVKAPYFSASRPFVEEKTLSSFAVVVYLSLQTEHNSFKGALKLPFNLLHPFVIFRQQSA